MDWSLRDFSSLLPYEQHYLNSFDDGSSAPNSTAAVTVSKLVAYPNPCNGSFVFTASATDSVKVKLVMVNTDGMVVSGFATRFKGNTSLLLNVADRNKFPDKSPLRLFYSFSTATNANFKSGYGDIQICSASNGTGATVSSCF